jgi:hypothetical protein
VIGAPVAHRTIEELGIMSVGTVGTSNAYSYLQSLLQQQQSANGSSSASDPVTQLLSAFYPSGTGQSASSSAAASSTAASSTATDSNAGAGCFSFSPDTMASLISIQGQQWHQSIDAQAQHVFGEFDADGDGSISKSEFEAGFGSNADMSKVDGLFSALDTNGDGSISLDELTSAAEQSHAHHHHMHGAGPDQGGGLADLLSSTDLTGATSQTATNADGSTSTTITYADGSTVSMTTPAPSSSDASSSNSNGNANGNASDNNISNLLERLIQLQAQLLASVSNQTSLSA